MNEAVSGVRRAVVALCIGCWSASATLFVGDSTDAFAWALLGLVAALTVAIAALNRRAVGISPLTRADRLDESRRRALERAGNLGHGLTAVGTCLVFGALAGYALGERGELFPVTMGAGEVLAVVSLGCVSRGWMLAWTVPGRASRPTSPAR